MWDNKYIPLTKLLLVPEQEHNAEKRTKEEQWTLSSFNCILYINFPFRFAPLISIILDHPASNQNKKLSIFLEIQIEKTVNQLDL